MNKGLLISIIVVIGLLVIIAATSGLFKEGQANQETETESHEHKEFSITAKNGALNLQL